MRKLYPDIKQFYQASSFMVTQSKVNGNRRPDLPRLTTTPVVKTGGDYRPQFNTPAPLLTWLTAIALVKGL